mgnify:CR=1 FL=1
MNKKATISLLSVSVLLITGCAVPVPFQVASWALDGISYVMTEKSMTDHGLSAVAQKDCAVWRGVTAGELCREWQDGSGILMVDKSATDLPGATAGFKPRARLDILTRDPKRDDSQPSGDQMMNLVTDSGSGTEPVSATNLAQPVRNFAAPTPSLFLRKSIALSTKQKRSARKALSVSMTRVGARSEPASGLYFVIGSFRKFGSARALASRHGVLVPAVLMAKLDGGPVYRVVVGPAVSGREKYLHRRISEMGLRDTWAIRVQPGDWSIARRDIEHVARVTQDSELAQSLQ